MEPNSGVDEKSSYFCLPTQVPEVVNNDAAIAFVKSFRHAPLLVCTRCQSTYTKRVNSKIFDDLSRCVDCGYMFNSLSGTVFQGTKLPIVKLIQATVILDSQKDDINLRDLSYALDVSYKTALGLQRKIQHYGVPGNYIKNDGDYAGFDIHTMSDGHKFAHYCAMHKLSLNKSLFYHRIESMLVIE